MAEQAFEVASALASSGISLGFFLEFRQAIFDCLDVCQYELGINNVNIFFWIYLRIIMAEYIVIMKSPDNMSNSITLADIRQKLVTQTLAF